jgi:site-specific recombinase XerC
MFFPSTATSTLSAPFKTHYTSYEEALEQQSLSKHTRRNYLTQVRQFLLFAQKLGCDDSLLLSDESIRDEVIELYRATLKEQMNASNGSINTVLATIKHFYKLSGKDIPGAQREQGKSGPRLTLRVEEVARVLGVLQEPICSRDKAIITLFYFGGLRLQECVDLNISDVAEISNGFNVIVNSNGEPRAIPIIGDAAHYLKGWLLDRNTTWFQASDALFLNRHGERISPSGFDSIVRKTGLRARLILSARLLRNTWLMEQKRSNEVVPELESAENA